MERDTNQMSQSASLCRSGCGFYGNPSSDGLCSKCYKDALKRKQSAPPSSTPAAASVGVVTTGRNSPTTSVTESSSCLPLIATISPSGSSLNTATPTVPCAISASAQDSAYKLEGAIGPDNNNSIGVETADSKAASAQPPSPVPESSTSNDDPPKTQKKKKTKCTQCRTNVGVIGFPCRCGGIFCSTHRYANEHSCSYDYKAKGAEEIRKSNPQVIGEKIQKL